MLVRLFVWKRGFWEIVVFGCIKGFTRLHTRVFGCVKGFTRLHTRVFGCIKGFMWLRTRVFGCVKGFRWLYSIFKKFVREGYCVWKE